MNRIDIGSCSTWVLQGFRDMGKQKCLRAIAGEINTVGKGQTFVLVTHMWGDNNNRGMRAALRSRPWWKLWNHWYAERVAFVPCTAGQIWIITKRGVIF